MCKRVRLSATERWDEFPANGVAPTAGTPAAVSLTGVFRVAGARSYWKRLRRLLESANRAWEDFLPAAESYTGPVLHAARHVAQRSGCRVSKIALTAALAAVLMAAPGCDAIQQARAAREAEQQTAEQAPKEERIVVPVEAQKPHRGAISEYEEPTTRVTAERRVEVTSEGTGKCLAVHAEEGDRVTQGAVLAELDQSDAQAQVRQSEVQVQQTRADYERAKEMLADDLISQAEYDNAYFSHQNAVATLETQRLTLDNLIIDAPISGIITARHIQKGMLVSSGTPAFEIVDPTSYVLSVELPEQDLPNLHEGQQAKVAIDALPGEEFEARIQRINPTVDPATGTVKVQLGMDDVVLSRLREGAFARVRLIMDTSDHALLVPKDAVIEENARDYVFVVRDEMPEEDEEEADRNADAAADAEDGDDAAEEGDGVVESRTVARRVEVVVGIEDSNYAEIVSGLSDDDWVVTLGQKNLKPGTEVVLTTAAEEVDSLADLSEEEALERAKVELEALEAEKAEEEMLRKNEAKGLGK